MIPFYATRLRKIRYVLLLKSLEFVIGVYFNLLLRFDNVLWSVDMFQVVDLICLA